MSYVRVAVLLCASLLIPGILLSCATRHPLHPRVPPENREEAKALRAPFGDTRRAPPAIIAEGRKLYEGKGACANCHGEAGNGEGPAAHMQHPHPPTDFTRCDLHEQREDGELFWVIDHGIPGTAMVDFVHTGKLTDVEAWKIVAYLRTLCEFR
jgi:mono/diheme cytochrome c family protein